MKKQICNNQHCKEVIEISDDYEPEYCCNGYMCGCYGYLINPVFCDPCELERYGKPIKDTHKETPK